MTSDELSDWLRAHGGSVARVEANLEAYEAVRITVSDGEGKTVGQASGWTIEHACERLVLS